MFKYLKCQRQRRCHRYHLGIAMSLFMIYALTRHNKSCPETITFLQRYPFINTSTVIYEVKEAGFTKTDEINNVYTLFNILKSPKLHRPKNVTLLIMVKSSVQNFARRYAIRKSWGSRRMKIDVLFSLGYDKSIDDAVDEEARVFNDILQGSFKDKYRNNTFKTSMNYKWISEYCSETNYVLFVDDDYFVNIDGILDFIHALVRTNSSGKMFGTLQKCGTPVRSPNNPNAFITIEEYPYEYYPPYLSGGSILTTIDVVMRILEKIPFVRRLSIDDLYIGIVAHFLKIDLVDHSKFTEKRQPLEQLNYFFCVHGFNESTLLFTHKYIKAIDRNNSKEMSN